MKLHKTSLARLVDEAERVDAEALHHAEASGDGPVRHDPHDHVHRFRHQRDEIPERVMCRSCLRDFTVRLRFDGVDEVGKLDGILDEEHRDVIADKVVIPFFSIELHGKAAHVTRQITGAAGADDGGEAHEDRRLSRWVLEKPGLRVWRQRFVDLEITMSCGAPRVNDTFGNAFVIEMGHLLAKMEVFDERRASFSRFERILVVVDTQALIRRQVFPSTIFPELLEIVMFVMISCGLVLLLSRLLLVSWSSILRHIIPLIIT